MTQGLIIVHTGDGKGKTTAALGLALRAFGAGLKVLILQFIKGGQTYGELDALKLLPIEIKQCGLGFSATCSIVKKLLRVSELITRRME